MARREEVMKYFDEQKEYTQDRVNAGIEQNRKGFCVLEVVDEDGKK